MAKRRELGKPELPFRVDIRIGGGTRQGIAVIEPFHEIAITAAG